MPCDYKKYPSDWKTLIRPRIIERGGNRCEGSPAYPDCRAENGKPHPVTGSKVVLTVAHLNHKPMDCRDENLKLWCQMCHNTYDMPFRIKNRKRKCRKL